MPLYRPACQVSHQHCQQRTFSLVGSHPREGPAGANILIYHLPHDLMDAYIAMAFNQFGNLLSSKVYVDSHTGKSKGFDFISYNPVVLAKYTIDQMNGFQIGSKRPKVQQKRVHHSRSSERGGGGASGQGVGGGAGIIRTPPPPHAEKIWTAAGGDRGKRGGGTNSLNDATANQLIAPRRHVI